MASYPEIKVGDVIEIHVQLYSILGDPSFPAGTQAEIDEHPDDRIGDVVAWLPDGESWTDPFEDLQPGQWSVVS